MLLWKILYSPTNIRLPFSDSDKNREYGALLSESINAFHLVGTPISPPKFPDLAGTSDRLSTGGIVVCIGGVFGAGKWRKASRSTNGNGTPSDLQPAAHPLPPTDVMQSGECQVAIAEDGFSPNYKDQGLTVLGDSKPLSSPKLWSWVTKPYSKCCDHFLKSMIPDVGFLLWASVLSSAQRHESLSILNLMQCTFLITC